MRFRPPLADHPRLALVASVLVPFVGFAWAMPRITGEPRRWPYVFAMTLILALMNYVARTRSARFQGYVLIGVSAAALMLYGYVTAAHGIPQQRNELVYWVLVVAFPVAGLALGWWVLQRPRVAK